MKKRGKDKKNMKRTKRNFFRDNYLKSWEFLKESKKYIYAIVIIFLVFAFIGFFLPIPESLLERILEFIREIIEKTENMSLVELINFIFINNLKVSFLGMAAGIFFGIFPILEALGNGYLLGFVAMNAIKVDGILSLWKILPHGIFELPAVFISLGLGLRLGLHIFIRKKKRNFKESIIESLRLFVFVVIPLLIIAALIEGVFVFILK
jgi:stage II sporulation protein M